MSEIAASSMGFNSEIQGPRASPARPSRSLGPENTFEGSRRGEEDSARARSQAAPSSSTTRRAPCHGRLPTRHETVQSGLALEANPSRVSRPPPGVTLKSCNADDVRMPERAPAVGIAAEAAESVEGGALRRVRGSSARTFAGCGDAARGTPLPIPPAPHAILDAVGAVRDGAEQRSAEPGGPEGTPRRLRAIGSGDEAIGDGRSRSGGSRPRGCPSSSRSAPAVGVRGADVEDARDVLGRERGDCRASAERSRIVRSRAAGRSTRARP